jgi:glutathione S-transferase
MIKLYQFPPLWGLPNLSPFCIKVETYLRLADIPYQAINIHSPHKGPKGKLPFIVDGDKKIADSSFIIEYLKEKYGDKLDVSLTPTQKATGLAVQHLLEEHLYWNVLYDRWVEEAGWQIMNRDIFSKIAIPFKWFIPQLFRKKIAKACQGQGIGRFSVEERVQLGKKDIDAIVTLQGNNLFFFGETPTSLDANLWGFLTPLLNSPLPSALADYAKAIPALVAYDKRMRALFDQLVSVKVAR